MLEDGISVVMFPEGTRSPTGALQRAKDGVTLLALRTGAPILPMGVAGTDRFWPRGSKLWRVGGRIAGFGSWDPRQAPDYGIIGHNCVLPEFRGEGLGKQQIL